MICPKCQKFDTQVIDTRDSNDGIRRRRECLECKYRFTTYERSESIHLIVIKKDSSREPFNPDKIRRGVQIACKNRPVTDLQIEALVEQIEHAVTFAGKDCISSNEIGKLVEAQLKELDEIAYIRFVSVYQSFSDVKQFSSTIKSLN